MVQIIDNPPEPKPLETFIGSVRKLEVGQAALVKKNNLKYARTVASKAAVGHDFDKKFFAYQVGGKTYIRRDA